jgi:trehalose-6-phosphatase
MKGGRHDKVFRSIGDDTTDEDAFKVVKLSGFSISVGGSAFADYYVEKQEDVVRVLEELLAILEEPNSSNDLKSIRRDMSDTTLPWP